MVVDSLFKIALLYVGVCIKTLFIHTVFLSFLVLNKSCLGKDRSGCLI